MTEHHLSLVKFDGRAVFRTHGPDALSDYVIVQVDRDRFNAMGKPGYITVTIEVDTKDSYVLA